MATRLPFTPTRIRPSASSDHRRSDSQRPKPPSVSANWWAPIFGFSSNPNYVDGDQTTAQNTAGSDPDPVRAGSRFAPGCFTEEKARQLRKKTIETATFHDIMYHSAIASRLASDLSD